MSPSTVSPLSLSGRLLTHAYYSSSLSSAHSLNSPFLLLRHFLGFWIMQTHFLILWSVRVRVRAQKGTTFLGAFVCVLCSYFVGVLMCGANPSLPVQFICRNGVIASKCVCITQLRIITLRSRRPAVCEWSWHRQRTQHFAVAGTYDIQLFVGCCLLSSLCCCFTPIDANAALWGRTVIYLISWDNAAFWGQRKRISHRLQGKQQQLEQGNRNCNLGLLRF